MPKMFDRANADYQAELDAESEDSNKYLSRSVVGGGLQLSTWQPGLSIDLCQPFERLTCNGYGHQVCMSDTLIPTVIRQCTVLILHRSCMHASMPSMSMGVNCMCRVE